MEDQLRQTTREALTAQLQHYKHLQATHEPDHPEREHWVVSQAQTESAMRVLWMEGS